MGKCDLLKAILKVTIQPFLGSHEIRTKSWLKIFSTQTIIIKQNMKPIALRLPGNWKLQNNRSEQPMQPLPPASNRNSILFDASLEHLPALLLFFSVFVGGILCIGVGVGIATSKWLSGLVVFVSFRIALAAGLVSFPGLIFVRGCIGAVWFLLLFEAALDRAFLKGTPKEEEFFAESLKGVGASAEAVWVNGSLYRRDIQDLDRILLDWIYLE